MCQPFRLRLPVPFEAVRHAEGSRPGGIQNDGCGDSGAAQDPCIVFDERDGVTHIGLAYWGLPSNDHDTDRMRSRSEPADMARCSPLACLNQGIFDRLKTRHRVLRLHQRAAGQEQTGEPVVTFALRSRYLPAHRAHWRTG